MIFMTLGRNRSFLYVSTRRLMIHRPCRGALSRQRTRGKRNLQVKPARMRIHVQHFACKEQPRHFLAHHRARRNLQHIDAAAGNNRFFNGARSDDMERKCLECMPDCLLCSRVT